MQQTLTPAQKIHYNQTFLGMISDPRERLEFVMKTLYPEHNWNAGANPLGLIVGYACDVPPGPKIKEVEVFNRLSEEFGVRNRPVKAPQGLARKALSQVVFPDPADAKPVFFA